jgi:hypothetical protein
MGFIMRKKTIINFMILSSLLIVVISLSFSSNVTAVTDSFTENFSSTSYRDFVNSDVSDWGSGEIRISNQEPSELGGVMILNISNSLSPSFVGNYTPTVTSKAEDVCISGDYAYIGYSWAGFHIIDISDPENPTNVYTYNPGDAWGDVEVIGNYAYVISNLGLYVFDVTNLGSVSVDDFIGYPPTGLPNGLKIQGNYAYIASGNVNLWVVDITDTTNILDVGTFGPSEYGRNLFISGDFVYVASATNGVNIYNISNPLSPIVIGDYSGIFGDQIYNTYIVDDTLYCSGGTNGLIVVDVSDPTTPSQYTVADTAGETKAIVVIGGLAYIADGPNGLQILDVSTIYQYNTESTAQSYAVFTGEQETLLRNATLTATDTIVVNTAIDYYLSADNGVNWESITSGVLHTFINQGYQLKWKAVLSTTNIDITPYIDTISIDYISKLNAVSLLNPYNGIVTIDDTPTFEWAELTGISDYLIQIDETDDFLAPVINETVADTTYTVSSALAPKTYYWRVSGIDNGGDTGIFSEARILVIQALVPEFNFISFSVFTLITLSIVFVVVLKRKRS